MDEEKLTEQHVPADPVSTLGSGPPVDLSQEITSTASRGYLVRLALMAFMFIGFGFWALYDGAVKYPGQIEIYEQYVEIKEAGRLSEWPEKMEQYGWPEVPTKREKGDIMTQYIMMGITMPLGLFFLAGLIRYSLRKLTYRDGKLIASWAGEFSADEVVELNNNRAKTKGISVVTARRGGGGKEQVVVLDNWKFDQHPTDAIIYLLQQSLSSEKITGDPVPLPVMLGGQQPDAADEADQV